MIWNHTDGNHIPSKPIDLQAIISRCPASPTQYMCCIWTERHLPFWIFTLRAKERKAGAFEAYQWLHNGGASSSMCACFFSACNVVVFLLFYKDCWNQWKVVFQSRALDCSLYSGRSWCLAAGAWNVIWSACMIELTKIILLPSWWLLKWMHQGEQFRNIFKDLTYVPALQGAHKKAV